MPSSGVAGFMVVFLLIFKGVSTLSCTVAVSVYTPSNSARWLGSSGKESNFDVASKSEPLCLFFAYSSLPTLTSPENYLKRCSSKYYGPPTNTSKSLGLIVFKKCSFHDPTVSESLALVFNNTFHTSSLNNSYTH